MKAFITNKIADIGLMIGIIVLALSTGTMRISEILYQSTHDYASLKSVAYLAGVLLFIGAMGKSAQFPENNQDNLPKSSIFSGEWLPTERYSIEDFLKK